MTYQKVKRGEQALSGKGPAAIPARFDAERTLLDASGRHSQRAKLRAAVETPEYQNPLRQLLVGWWLVA
jgi:hypothetical protein